MRGLNLFRTNQADKLINLAFGEIVFSILVLIFFKDLHTLVRLLFQAAGNMNFSFID